MRSLVDQFGYIDIYAPTVLWWTNPHVSDGRHGRRTRGPLEDDDRAGPALHDHMGDAT
jgi:hypothetical protein